MKNEYSYVYLMTNVWNKVLYVGVTSNLVKRLFEHKQKLITGFTERYKITKLVYYEQFDSIITAIEREKQIKGWLRQKKVDLIEADNPQWRDLADTILDHKPDPSSRFAALRMTES